MKKNNLQCYDCLPARPLNGHPTLYGALVHSRNDCPKDVIYTANEDNFVLKRKKKFKWYINREFISEKELKG